MKGKNIEADALDYLRKEKEKNPEDYNNIIRQEINDLDMKREMKERDKKELETKIDGFKKRDQQMLQEAGEIQEKLIKLQKDIHWMEAQASKAKKNEFEMDRLLQEELHKYLLALKYSQVKSLLSRFKARSKKHSGPSAVLVLYFLENPLELEEGQKMPYLSQVFAITDMTTIKDVYDQSINFFELNDTIEERADSGGQKTEEEADSKSLSPSRRGDDNEAEGLEELTISKRVRFQNENKDVTKKKPKRKSNQKMGDGKKYCITDTSHNDLRIIINVPVKSFYAFDEGTNFCVFYLRERTPNQEELFESQEESLGMRRDKNPATTKTNKDEEQYIEKTLKLLEEEKRGLKTYGNKVDYDFGNNFSVDFPNFLFNLIILIVMSVQIFWVLDLDTSLMRQSWKRNQHFNEHSNVKISDIQTYIYDRLLEVSKNRTSFDTIIVASLIPQFVGPKVLTRDPVFRYHEKTKFGVTNGVLRTYQESGYRIHAKNARDRAEKFKNLDFKKIIIQYEIEAVILHGLYYIPSYRSWILRAIIFEFPRDNDIRARARVDPIRLKNRDDPEVKMRLILDIANIVLQLILAVFRFIFAYKNDRGNAIYFFFFNFTILILVSFAHLFYFNFYETHQYDLDDFQYFRNIYSNGSISKRFMIVAFLLHAYQTLFSLHISSSMIYILTVIKITQNWLWPLILMYFVVILILSFMVDNLTSTFQMSISNAMISMFRMIANSNLKFWYPLINESPEWFIIFVIGCVFWIFYIVNNIYFGIQFEIVRLLDASKQGKILGFYKEFKLICNKKKKASLEDEELEDDGGEENLATVIPTDNR